MGNDVHSSVSGRFRKAALRVLEQADRPLTATEIVNIALRNGYLITDGQTPGNTMNALLTRDIRNKGRAAGFIKLERGRFKLAQPIPHG